MAHTYDEEVRLLDTQAKSGRITVAQAQVEVESLLAAQADHLEEKAGIFWQDRELAGAYRAKAAELRDSVDDEVREVGGTAGERRTLQKAIVRSEERLQSRVEMLEKTTYAGSPMARPIGMPAPATTTPTGPTIGRGPDTRPAWPTNPSRR